jgi:hypothetical protein
LRNREKENNKKEFGVYTKEKRDPIYKKVTRDTIDTMKKLEKRNATHTRDITDTIDTKGNRTLPS